MQSNDAFAYSLLTCIQYVDEVVIGAPYSITEEFLNSSNFNISVVANGKNKSDLDVDGSDPYISAKKAGKYVEIETEFSYLTVEIIVDRIIQQRCLYEERNRKKNAQPI